LKNHITGAFSACLLICN